MHLFIEGPDGAGKTTLINKLNKFGGLEIRGLGDTTFISGRLQELPQGPPTDREAFIQRVEKLKDLLKYNGDEKTLYLYDRSPIISEFIYGTALRNKSFVNILALELFCEHYHTIICLPERETYLGQTVEEGKEHKSEEHMKSVKKNRPHLHACYKELAEDGDLYVYDHTEPFADERLAIHLSTLWLKENGACAV